MDILTTILSNPQLIHSLGLTTAMAIFLGPIFYNGDFSKPIRAITVLGGCFLFSVLLFYGNDMSGQNWIITSILLGLVNLSYILGLYIGILIYRLTKKDCEIHTK